ncbi:MAG: synthase gamma chain, partial [Planctomycetota bacterium]
YNSNVVRQAMGLMGQWASEQVDTHVTVSGKRGISALRFRKVAIDAEHTHFEDKPAFAEVAPIGEAYLSAYIAGTIDRLDVVYTQFTNIARQEAVIETLLPLKPPEAEGDNPGTSSHLASQEYDFYPSASSILEEILPASFQSRLFKCFLDAAVSEQVSRMVAMKGATENATGLIRHLSSQFNRARQSQITGEIMEILGGVEALKK